MKQRKQKKPRQLISFFSQSVFTTISIAMLISGIIVVLLIEMHIFRYIEPLFIIIYITVIGTAMSTIIARAVGNKIVTPIKEISRAMHDVAGGNFDISLVQESGIEEMQDITHSFNMMTQELAHTEIVSSDFTRNVSHEFKTPLSAIEGYAALLQAPNLDEEKRAYYAAKIIANTKRLSSLTGNILELSRLENKQLGLEKTSFALDEQLRQVGLLYEDDWMSKSLTINTDLPEMSFTANEDLLFQVWQNIFGNAVKFSSQGGEINLRLERNGEFVSVSIEDTGIGISVDDQKRIFEKFYQGDKSHSIQGNGLGLAISKQIVELHGGNIKVDSKCGVGTIFTVSFPAER